MAADPQTLTKMDTILKERYLPTFRKAFNQEAVLLYRLKRKAPTKVFGRKYIFPLHYRRNFGVGFRGETGADDSGYSSTEPYLPVAGHQGLTEGYLTRSHCYGKFKITGATISAGKADGSMVDVMDTEMNGLRKDMAKYINRNLYGDGTGALAVDQASGAQNGVTTITVDSTRYLEADMPIVLASSTGTSATDQTDAGATLKITSVDSETQITVPECSYTGGDYIYPAGLYDSTKSAVYGNACDGLKNIISDGTYDGTNGDLDYAGIDRSSEHFGDATLIDGTAGLDPDLMFQAIHEMRKAAGGKCSLILTSFKQWRMYGNTFHGARNWEGNVKRLDGGFDALFFNTIPVVPDVDCPDDVIWFLDERDFAILQEEPLHFIEDRGTVLQWLGAGDTGVDAYEACLCWRFAICCYNPKAQAKIHSLPTS